MDNLYIIDVIEMLDIDKIEEYNRDFQKSHPDSWRPFVTRDNFDEYLKNMKNLRENGSKDGVKEIYYWLIDDEKIVGSGSIRLNPEVDDYTNIFCGHLFYQILPSQRGKGYGKILCHLLLKEMQNLGFKEAFVTCFDTNIGSRKIIEENGGQFIEYVYDEEIENPDWVKNRRYKIDTSKSLANFNEEKYIIQRNNKQI